MHKVGVGTDKREEGLLGGDESGGGCCRVGTKTTPWLLLPIHDLNRPKRSVRPCGQISWSKAESQ